METTGILMLLVVGVFGSVCLIGLIDHVLATLINRKNDGWN